ncbi:MAG TPA: outer membrane beta-barrel protein [Longimicrobiales bacterium]|nr:outer membrane beta-barrel protein [Longimicrobiales bacterium]
MRQFLGVFALIPLAALAVTARPAAAQFGFRGGANLSKFVGGDTGSESKTKLKLGATIPMFHVGPVSLVPEVYYAQRGAKTQASPFGSAAGGIYDFSMDYIEVPVLAKLSLPIPGAPMLRPYIAGGPVYAWQLKCEYSLESAASQAAQDCKDPQLSSASAAMKSADKGIAGAAGVDLAVGGIGAVNLDLRVVRGLSRLTENATGPDVKSQSVSLMLGYSVMR